MQKTFTNIVFLLLLFFALGNCNLKAQNDASKRQLAQQYYSNKEFEKAAFLYEDLFNKSKSKVYFNYYLRSLIEIKNFSDAEKLIKKQIRSQKADMNYHVELGYLYRITGKQDKSKEEYEFAIKNVKLEHQVVVQLANIFISKREFDYAEQLYLKASKRLQDLYSFKFELANLYYYSRNYEKMIETYISVLVDNQGYIQTVQNKLQNAVYSDVNDNLKDLLKSKLIEQIQNHPDKIVLNELLIWLYIQEKEFSKALIQVKALDRRNNEDGERLVALARLAKSNKNYEVSVSAYERVLEKGKEESYYYYIANNELLSLLFNQIVIEKDYSHIDISQLEEKYKTTISELGLNNATAIIMKNLAHLQAFYLNKTDLAIDNLEKTITLQIDLNNKSECKLELADIYLFKNRVWDATMQYAEVELQNKNNPTGSKAKFKKAILAYYLGNFLWSKAQLDVLKASTSKLIANDSFALSKLIEDNSIFDENDAALTQFSAAQLKFYQNQDSIALITIDSIINDFSGHPIIDEAYFFKAEIFEENKNYLKAEEFYEKVYKQYAFEVLGDNALMKLAELNQFQFNNTEKAMEYYQNVLIDFPESVYVVSARERYRELRGDNIQ